MALFATAEEKEIKKKEKELKKKEKEEEKFQRLVKKYNLTNIGIEDYELIRKISLDTAGDAWGEIGILLDFNTKTEDRLKINKLQALQEQNWIIINQLGRLNKNISELIELNKNK